MSYLGCSVRLYLQLFVGDEPNILNKTFVLLQTTRGKDEPNILNKTCIPLQTTGGKDEPNKDACLI
jgi:hypothetical protein